MLGESLRHVGKGSIDVAIFLIDFYKAIIQKKGGASLTLVRTLYNQLRTFSGTAVMILDQKGGSFRSSSCSLRFLPGYRGLGIRAKNMSITSAKPR